MNKWPYVAGLVDGEGTICLHEGFQDNCSHFSLQVVVYNTSIKLMKWLLGNFGGKFYPRPYAASKLSKRLQYAWHPSGAKNRENFLLGILPYLVVKNEQAKLALEFLRLNGAKNPELRRQLTAKCQQLNREESPEANTSDTLPNLTAWACGPELPENLKELKIESELHSDVQSAPLVTATA